MNEANENPPEPAPLIVPNNTPVVSVLLFLIGAAIGLVGWFAAMFIPAAATMPFEGSGGGGKAAAVLWMALNIVVVLAAVFAIWRVARRRIGHPFLLGLLAGVCIAGLLEGFCFGSIIGSSNG
jgi:hypothetical protein